jgi:hypothetical protein
MNHEAAQAACCVVEPVDHTVQVHAKCLLMRAYFDAS